MLRRVISSQPRCRRSPKGILRTMSSTIKPWPQPMVESKGDYRAESFLEDHIGGKLYSQQHSLPRLPIPEVKDTLDRFLPTALPLAKSEEEKATLVEAVQHFEGQSVELQKRLIERREGEMKDSSWLQYWWNTLGYLQVRPLAFKPAIDLIYGASYTFCVWFSFMSHSRFEIPWLSTSVTSSTFRMTEVCRRMLQINHLVFRVQPLCCIHLRSSANLSHQVICRMRPSDAKNRSLLSVRLHTSICSTPAVSRER